MTDLPAPDDVVALAQERATAREARDWRAADDLRASIEAQGWRVVDDGSGFSLTPATTPDIERDGEVIYGSVASVPSRMHEPDSHVATIAVLAPDIDTSPIPALTGLAAHRPDNVQIVVVTGSDGVIQAPTDEVVRTIAPFTPGDALEAAIRRATGGVVVVLEPERMPTDDVVVPLIAALDDSSVAVAGIEGLASRDLRRYAPAGPGDVTAFRAGCYAFRRAAAIARGPIDGRLNLPGSVATWWSLVLRDESESQPPRRALALELPLRSTGVDSPVDQARLARRDAYRIADRFRGHDRLVAPGEEGLGVPGDGADGDDHGDGSDQSEHAS